MPFFAAIKHRYIPEGSLRGRLAGGAYWSLLGAFFTQGFRLITYVFVARILGRMGFGEYGMVLSSVALFAGLGGFGLGISVSKHVAEFREVEPDQAGNAIGISLLAGAGIGLLASLLFFIFSPEIGVRLLNSQNIVPILRQGSLLIVLGSIDGTMTSTIAGFESFRNLARIGLAKGAIELSVVVLATGLWGLTGAVVGMVFATAIACLISWVTVQGECRKHGILIRVDRHHSGTMRIIRFGAAAYLGSIVVQPAFWGGNALLVNQPGGYSEMGLFTAVDKWRIAVLFFPTAVSKIYLPVFSNLYARGEIDRFEKVLRLMIFWTAFFALVLTGATILFSETILGAFGREFRGDRRVLMLLTASGIFISTNAILGQALLSMDKAWQRFYFDAALAVVFFFASVILVTSFSAVGLSAAYLLSFLVISIALTIYVSRSIRLFRLKP